VENTINANINNAECLKEAENLFTYTIHNICTGKVTEIEKGDADIMAMFIVLFFVIVMITFVIGLLVSLIRI